MAYKERRRAKVFRFKRQKISEKKLKRREYFSEEAKQTRP
jgi:hypothetical protein